MRGIPQLDAKRCPPADSPQRVVRLATREDIVARLKQQHREQEAFRIALLKIRERGLGMKLARVEQSFDHGHGRIVLAVFDPRHRRGRHTGLGSQRPPGQARSGSGIGQEFRGRSHSDLADGIGTGGYLFASILLDLAAG